MAENGRVTTSQLAKLTGLTQGRVRTILQELITGVLVIKDGDYRYTSYSLKTTESKQITEGSAENGRN